MSCPCGSARVYETCCHLFHNGMRIPETAELLMRSRYSAFVKNEVQYLRATTWPPRQKHFDDAGYSERAAASIWLGLLIHETTDGAENDTRGTVTFTAKSMLHGTIHEQTEISLFKKKKDRWYYVKPMEVAR